MNDFCWLIVPAGQSRKSQCEAAAVQVREEHVTAAAVRNASDDDFQEQRIK